jgi:hypothetical protein
VPGALFKAGKMTEELLHALLALGALKFRDEDERAGV